MCQAPDLAEEHSNQQLLAEHTGMPVLLDVIDIIELAPLYLQSQHTRGSTRELQRGLDPFLELLRGRTKIEVLLPSQKLILYRFRKNTEDGGTGEMAFVASQPPVPSSAPRHSRHTLATHSRPPCTGNCMYRFSFLWARFDVLLS